MHHELKILPPYFEAVIDGRKTFEIRKDDRGFQAGDTVTLREYDPAKVQIGTPKEWGYTRREYKAKIGYVTAYEQQPGYVVFSLVPNLK